MIPPSPGARDKYHYAENGVTRGPLTLRQLRELAKAGEIQPQTLVWKEGSPEWVPANSVKGLLPAVPAAPGQPPGQPGAGLPEGARWPTGILIGVGAGTLILIAGLVVLLIILRNYADKDEKDEEDGEPVRHSRFETRNRPPAFKAQDLLAKYRDEPRKTIRDWKGKTITLKVQGLWEVEELKPLIKGNGNLEVPFFTDSDLDLETAAPHQVILLIFPLSDANDKLGFFNKIKEYVTKREKGDRVSMSVTGTLSTFQMHKQTFLRLEDAVLD